MRPKSCGNKFNIIAQWNNSIVIARYILSNLQRPAVIEFVQVEQLVKLVVVRDDYHLLIVL